MWSSLKETPQREVYHYQSDCVAWLEDGLFHSWTNFFLGYKNPIKMMKMRNGLFSWFGVNLIRKAAGKTQKLRTILLPIDCFGKSISKENQDFINKRSCHWSNFHFENDLLWAEGNEIGTARYNLDDIMRNVKATNRVGWFLNCSDVFAGLSQSVLWVRVQCQTPISAWLWSDY